MNYYQDNDLLKVLKNKRVAIVGPSPHLIDLNMGQIIDSYDIVCRVNEIHPTGYENDYGNRTDIIFHNCGARFIETFGHKLNQNLNITKSLKYVICPCVKNTGADNNWIDWSDDYESGVVNNFKSINDYNVPFYWIGMKNYREIYNHYTVEPNAGQTSICILLEHDVRELFVTGFSFYSQGNKPCLSHRPGHTYEGLEQEHIGDEGHPQNPQIKAFRNKVLKEYGDKIMIDSYLNDILDLKHGNVMELQK